MRHDVFLVCRLQPRKVRVAGQAGPKAVDLHQSAVQNKAEAFAACRRGRFKKGGTRAEPRTLSLSRSIPPSERSPMPVRLRKLIGTVLIIILVIVYALAAVTFASLLLGASPWWVHLLYFFFTGLLWILPAMLIIKWMEKPAKNR
jgi:hypothetical protein